MLFSVFMNLYHEWRAFLNIFHWGNYKDDRHNTLLQLMDFSLFFSTHGFLSIAHNTDLIFNIRVLSVSLNSICFSVQFSSVQSLSHVRLFATPWTIVRQASLSITNSQSLPKLMSIESVMSSSHLILYSPLLLVPSIFPNIRAFSNEPALRIR